MFLEISENCGISNNTFFTEHLWATASGFRVKTLLSRQKTNEYYPNLREKVMILKPDKGQGIVLVNKDDYIQNIEYLFSDKTKFQVLNKDPILQFLNTVQNYVNKLFNCGEISNDEKKLTCPKFAQISRAHGFLKTHKKFEVLLPFRPIVDTTKAPYYSIAKFLANLKAWFPPMRLTYSHKSKLISLMRLYFIGLKFLISCVPTKFHKYHIFE